MITNLYKKLIICGLNTIEVSKWKANVVYKNCTDKNRQIRWFWQAIESFDNERRTKLLQLITGSKSLPLIEFSEIDEENSSPFTIFLNRNADKNSLPVMHTCFNRIDLPTYENYEKLLAKLNLTIDETRQFSVQ